MVLVPIDLNRKIIPDTRYLVGSKHLEIEVLVRTFFKLMELGMDLDVELVEDAARRVERGYMEPIEIYRASEMRVKNLRFSKRLPSLLTAEEKCKLPL